MKIKHHFHKLFLLLLLSSISFAAPPTEILSAEPLVGFQQDGCRAVLSFRFEMDNGWAAGQTFEEDNQTYKLSVLMLDSQVQGRWEACGEYEADCEPGIEPVIYNPQDFKAGWYQAKLSLLKIGQINEVLDSVYLTFDLRDILECKTPVERLEVEKPSQTSGKFIPPELKVEPLTEPPVIWQPSMRIDSTAVALLVVLLAMVASAILYFKFSR